MPRAIWPALLPRVMPFSGGWRQRQSQRAAGQVANVEVKSGGAVGNASQVAKDSEIATQGGTYIGKNAPESMRGQTVKIPTEVRKPDQK